MQQAKFWFDGTDLQVPFYETKMSAVLFSSQAAAYCEVLKTKIMFAMVGFGSIAFLHLQRPSSRNKDIT